MSFQFVQPTEEQKALMQEFRDKFESISNEISEKVGSSRGLSLAKTKLEEAAFWLNKAITNNDN
jgi:ClpP class serine protease